MTPTAFKAALAEHDIQLSDQQMAQFATYFKLLVATNEKMNLTSITDEAGVYLKHFYDSLTPSFYVESLRHEALTICDVGAGAGFPSLPLKIAFPQLKITIVDSLNKRIKFLNELAAALNLSDVAFYHDRAELFGSKRSEHCESFDLVTARAVARLNVLSELCLPLVKKGGQFIALKGQLPAAELTEAKYAIHLLGGNLATNEAFELPDNGGARQLLTIVKRRQTPKRYPRRAGVPNKEPLVEKPLN
ncbi:16S rRNA (guanine(527)-N(7))-methyltransferase RsmG [Loigolactobacillus backii]|uniref:16S rRNA (guanine(527)-N(7))-methyltransferase RsmG n=1 Tax=Loigolactobacillus backii TaxID=375175 RepID=UPI0007F082E4|nr:16S rRNA (guanine(527)-N(7))-methyltransferase RsmG [Loigolactobacillus backii]ANK60460.1 16S rRNA methyltransferase G [Loigolactobacillus backii]